MNSSEKTLGNLIEVDPSFLLWRTGGKYWDFEFVTVPKALKLSAYWQLFKRIFGNSISSESNNILFGKFEVTRENDLSYYDYLAVSLCDPLRKDWTHRPIKHFLVLFFPLSGTEGLDASTSHHRDFIPETWHIQVMEHLDRFYQTIHSISYEEIDAIQSDQIFGDFLQKEYDHKVSSFKLKSDYCHSSKWNPITPKCDWENNESFSLAKASEISEIQDVETEKHQHDLQHLRSLRLSGSSIVNRVKANLPEKIKAPMRKFKQQWNHRNED